MIVAILLAATACAEEEDDRQFASDPRTPVAAPTEPATPATGGDAVVTTAAASPEALVDRRGAPSTAFADAPGGLWAVDGSGAELVVEGEILAFAASPGGDQVAVAEVDTSDPSETAYSVSIHGHDGAIVDTFANVLRDSDNSATPVDGSSATPAGNAMSPGPTIDLSWAAQGDRLLLTHSEGYLVDIPLDGEPRSIETTSPIDGALQADWSPRGDVIAVLMRDEAGQGELALVAPTEEPAGVTVIAPTAGATESRNSVDAFAWKANGSGVFYLEAELTESGPRNGSINQWDRESNSTSIVATGGQAGPSGSVTWFSVSPDGRAIMYRVVIATDDELSFNGLYVRSLDTGQVYRVPVSPSASVMEAWWIDSGVVSSQVSTTDSGTVLEFIKIAADSEQTRIVSYPLGASATPVASPVGSPEASPVASPSAPHEATPEETT